MFVKGTDPNEIFDYFRSGQISRKENHITPPDSLRPRYLQTSLHKPSLKQKIADFDQSFLLEIVNQILNDDSNIENFEKFKFNEQERETNLEFNENIKMIPLEKDQRRQNLKFKLYDDCEINLLAIKIRKNHDKEHFDVEIFYRAHDKNQEIQNTFKLNLKSEIEVQDILNLSDLIKLKIDRDKINSKIQKNIKNLRNNPYLVDSKLPLKTSDFLIPSNTKIILRTNDLSDSVQEYQISQIKLSKESPPLLYTETEDDSSEKYRNYIFMPILFNIGGQQYSTSFIKSLE